MVHFPMALLPTALAADALGRVTGSEALLEMGRRLMPLAALSAAGAGVAGLIAQESSKASEEGMRYLVTHRNLNIGVTALTAVLASKRVKRRRPSLGYLLAGAGGLLAMTYSAYLGGHMVYELGVGVRAAGGLDEAKAPPITPETAEHALELSKRHVATGLIHAFDDFADGRIAPLLTPSAAAEERENGERDVP